MMSKHKSSNNSIRIGLSIDSPIILRRIQTIACEKAEIPR